MFERTTEEALMNCQSVIHILEFLGFVINLKKSILNSNLGNIIFENDNQFEGNDFITAETENGRCV